jgi:hypothetical protein
MAAAASGVAGEMEVEAYRRLFPVAFLERHLGESVRIDARRLREARPTTVALGAVSSAHGSALVRLGDTVIRPLSSPSLSYFSRPLVSRFSIVRRIVFAGHARVGQARGDVAHGRVPRRRIRRFVFPFPCCFVLPLVFILLLMLTYLCFA